MMDWMIIGLAALGAILMNLLTLAEAHQLPKAQRPDFGDPLYYIAYIVFAFFGALFAFVYLETGFEVRPLLALHIGASAPLLVRTLASTVPREVETDVD
ncbi:MAG: hypothetical protein ACXIUL_11330 [Wenzhouxiangella sp.]